MSASRKESIEDGLPLYEAVINKADSPQKLYGPLGSSESDKSGRYFKLDNGDEDQWFSKQSKTRSSSSKVLTIIGLSAALLSGVILAVCIFGIGIDQIASDVYPSSSNEALASFRSSDWYDASLFKTQKEASSQFGPIPLFASTPSDHHQQEKADGKQREPSDKPAPAPQSDVDSSVYKERLNSMCGGSSAQEADNVDFRDDPFGIFKEIMNNMSPMGLAGVAKVEIEECQIMDNIPGIQEPMRCCHASLLDGPQLKKTANDGPVIWTCHASDLTGHLKNQVRAASAERSDINDSLPDLDNLFSSIFGGQPLAGHVTVLDGTDQAIDAGGIKLQPGMNYHMKPLPNADSSSPQVLDPLNDLLGQIFGDSFSLTPDNFGIHLGPVLNI
ncbi:hypothetical protein MIR68_007142 [Amoeboaphelidium protococcarum]|nr:hypothetical protein MIR68_007142 [Amoeboaphelidium protococcarum]